MSVPMRPNKFYVPELPRQYVSDFADSSQTTEALLLRRVLDNSASPTAAVVAEGVGGTGKTTSLLGVGHQPSTWARFPDAVYFISLGQDADPSALLEDLETVVRAVVGTSEAEEISRLSKRRNSASAATEAIQLLNNRNVLLLIDDVWADERACEVGRSTVFSLVQNCLRQVHKYPGRLRVVVSTRDASVATEVPESSRVLSQPLERCDPLAREMLCSYAEVSFNEIKRSGPRVGMSFNALLRQCGGLQLAIAIAGCGVRDRLHLGAERNETVWDAYANEVAEARTWLKKTHSGHAGIYAMLLSSLDHLKVCLENRDGVEGPFDLKIVFSFLAVVKKQEAVPLPVVACIWGMSEETTVQLCIDLARLHLIHLVSVKRGEDEMRLVNVHDLVLDFCVVVLCEKPERKAYAHCMTVKGLELLLFSGRRADMEGDGCAALWKLCDAELDAWTRDYFVRNIARHMMEAGGQYIEQLLHLVTDYRWTEARMKGGRNGADLSGILDDIQTLVTGCGEKMDAEVRRGLELISDGAQLSTLSVGKNPRELAYQLQGRLRIHRGRNVLVDRMLGRLEEYAERPWLKVGSSALTAPGGPVVLKVRLSQGLECVAALPNGEDVVVGGGGGYLAVFSIRYASELYRLRGHEGDVNCVAVCAATQGIFSSGRDGTIRAWDIGTGQEGGDIIVSHERAVCSLAVTTDGRWIVFGDGEGCLVVCDSISGEVRCKWRGHKDIVFSVAVREQDGMIVSGSEDGTIGRWEVTTGRGQGNPIDVGCGVYSVAVRRDGKKIAYGGWKSVGVVDVGSGNIIRQWSGHSSCVTFGSDDDTVHFGDFGGSFAALAPDGRIICEAKLHVDTSVRAIALLGRLLVSVCDDSTLAVQNLDRFESVHAVAPEEQYDPPKFDWISVLPDRNRVLYRYWEEDPGSLKLLDLRITSAEDVICEETLAKANNVVTVEQVGWVTAVAVSRDGRSAVLGTKDGKVSVYDTGSWRLKHSRVRCLRSSVEHVAVCNDGSFMAASFEAAGSSYSEFALFRLEDGSELQLPSASECSERGVETVAFNEESTCLLAIFVDDADEEGRVLHIWKHIDRAGDIQHVALPCDTIAPEGWQWWRTKLMATNDYIAIRRARGEEVCVYDLQNDQYSVVTTEEEDPSGILKRCNREHRALEKEGCLFMRPFEQFIRYCYGSGGEVLGTLEEDTVIPSFHPDQWTFCEETDLFITVIADDIGRKRLLRAALKNEKRMRQHGGRPEAPRLPLVWKKETLGNDNGTGMGGSEEREFKVFVSHAGPDKKEVAIPLYEMLEARGIRAFVDEEELRVGEEAPEEMQEAMDRASVGVFILSPEFAGRRWTLKELICFLERRRGSGRGPKTPALIPVFYRMGVRDCQSNDLYGPRSEHGTIIFQQGFYDPRRLAETSTEKAMQAMRDLTKFTGIERRRQAETLTKRAMQAMQAMHRLITKVTGIEMGEECSVDALLDRIANEVESVVRRQEEREGRGSQGESGNGSRGREECDAGDEEVEEVDVATSRR